MIDKPIAESMNLNVLHGNEHTPLCDVIAAMNSGSQSA